MEACPAAVAARLSPSGDEATVSVPVLGPGEREGGASECGTSPRSLNQSYPRQRQQPDGASSNSSAGVPNIELLPAISEYVVTAGDIGRPRTHLEKDFPQV
jgi:hypothetical protein